MTLLKNEEFQRNNRRFKMKIEDMVKLKEPFPETDLEWRLQSCGCTNGKFWGRALAYITSRAVQERFDEVCGPDGWQCAIRREGDAYLCTISVRVTHDDGTTEWISRTDGADATDIEPVKGGISGAIKRCAVLFGCGRYLYNLKDGWAIIDDNGQYRGKTKEGKEFKWNPPALPSEALPKGTTSSSPSKKSNPTPPSEDSIKKAEEIKNVLLDYSDIIPDEKWNDIDKAVSEGNTNYLERIVDWAKKEADKKSA